MALSMSATMTAQTDNTQTEERQPKALEQMLVYENPKIYTTIGDIKYVPKDKGQQTRNAIVSALASDDLPIEDETMVSLASNAMETGVTKALRFAVLAGAPTDDQRESNSLVNFTATITGCNTTHRLHDGISDTRILLTGYIYLTDVSTGEIVASSQVAGESWAGWFTSIEEAKNDAAHNLMVDVINTLNNWYPLRGHMLEKGFQKGKKQKLKEIFIDLGSDHGLGNNYDVNVYTVRRIAGRIARRYLGRGKIQEVMGGDISSVTLKKGADLIKQAFDNGDEIAISVY